MATPSSWMAALSCRCPRCGRGRLFEGLAATRPKCRSCGLNLWACDGGEGTAIAFAWLLGVTIVGLAAWPDASWGQPTEAESAAWPIGVILVMTVLVRPLKAALIGSRFRRLALANRL